MLPNRYNLQNLRRLFENPYLLSGELSRLGGELNRPFAARRNPQSDGIAVMDEDWDNLLILDACRYDMFERVNELPGTLRCRVSKGSESRQFMRRNFAGRTFHGTVYVTANPHAERLSDKTFHFIDKVYADHWDDDAGVVRPEVVVETAREAADAYPQKRLIVHFMQPHAPYLGPHGRTVEHNVTQDPSEEVRAVWANIRYGLTDTTIADVRRAYVENLELVLEHVAALRDALDGKIVVTADHGELLGDRLRPIPVRGYGHPPGLRVPALVRVPWLELPSESRREIRSAPPQSTEADLDRTTLERRLADLGYLDS